MRVWIDQDCCTGAGLCVDHCPELFIVLEDGIGYVHDSGFVVAGVEHPSVAVPHRYEQSAIDAVERCPGECIYLDPDDAVGASTSGRDDGDIVDAEIVD
jgi:ferredoxin